MIERSRVRIPAGAAGEISSPGSTFCADSYFGFRSTPLLPHLLSATVRVYSLVAPCHLPDLTSLALLGVSSRPARAF